MVTLVSVIWSRGLAAIAPPFTAALLSAMVVLLDLDDRRARATCSSGRDAAAVVAREALDVAVVDDRRVAHRQPRRRARKGRLPDRAVVGAVTVTPCSVSVPWLTTFCTRQALLQSSVTPCTRTVAPAPTTSSPAPRDGRDSSIRTLRASAPAAGLIVDAHVDRPHASVRRSAGRRERDDVAGMHTGQRGLDGAERACRRSCSRRWTGAARRDEVGVVPLVAAAAGNPPAASATVASVSARRMVLVFMSSVLGSWNCMTRDSV